MRRHVGQHGRRVTPRFERERVGERLQRRAGLARGVTAVDGAAVLDVEVVARPFPRQPFARARCRARRPRRCARRARSSCGRWLRMMPATIALQRARRASSRSARGRRSPAAASTISTKCGASERVASLREAQLLRRARLRAACVSVPAATTMRASTTSLAPPARARAAPRVEPGRPLRQRREKRGLRRRQHRRGAAEVGLARALGTGDLVAVRREVQIERENLALRQPMLQSHRDNRLTHFDPPPAREPWTGPRSRAARQCGLTLPIEQELRHLLRDRRPALSATPFPKIAPRRAHERDRVDAGMAEEAVILGRERGGDQRRRKRIRGEPQFARAQIRTRLVQHGAIAVDDDGRCRRRGSSRPAGSEPARSQTSAAAITTSAMTTSGDGVQ